MLNHQEESYNVPIEIRMFGGSFAIVLCDSDQSYWMLRSSIRSSSHNQTDAKDTPVIMIFIIIYVLHLFLSYCQHLDLINIVLILSAHSMVNCLSCHGA